LAEKGPKDTWIRGLLLRTPARPGWKVMKEADMTGQIIVGVDGSAPTAPSSGRARRCDEGREADREAGDEPRPDGVCATMIDAECDAVPVPAEDGALIGLITAGTCWPP
jgi:hypothetical protein